ncbi:DUF3124 domain-containing protein [Lacibacter sp. MH-610]|uniref:DUF3124 domain-containing protein n=1 Tax=Lacibacter sp. MH-610 TaxID=3020883 RepID=UPI0038922292
MKTSRLYLHQHQLISIFWILTCALLLFSSCKEVQNNALPQTADWSKRTATLSSNDSLSAGTTYLSVYSHIYTLSQERISDLTATISMRNTSTIDTLYLFKAEYFDTNGKSVRNYVTQPIFITPMETAEIVIEQKDNAGGSGANFIFDWKSKPGAPEPLFEAIMISTSGQQGLSFTTQGKRIK